MALWDGRFSSSQDENLKKFTESISFDRRLYRYDIRGSKAHAEMLADCGIISRKTARRISSKLDEIEAAIRSGSLKLSPDQEDIHMNIEVRLQELIGEAGALALVDPFDRAWRRVGLALDRVGFTVVDRDRSNGIYYVRYAPLETQPRKEGGFLSRLAFWRSSEEAKPRPEQYRVHVEPAAEGTRVSVLNKEGQPERSETGKKILSLLYEQLK